MMLQSAYGSATSRSRSGPEGRRIEIRGIVQGVGFRPWVFRLAQESGVTGRVRNDAQGVTIEAFGGSAALDGFLDRLQSGPPPAAAITALRWQSIPSEALEEFEIAASARQAARRVSIPADLATCPECLAEVFDRHDRRYRYAFTNCTHCGPRFTITREVPYDRPATTMRAFKMCPACQREYDTVSNRRFHAQANACPVCGPQLQVLSGRGQDLHSRDPISDAAIAIQAGLIVAVKGLGGFHLACDATSSRGLRRLRELKRRDEKPFAVMVRDLATAEHLSKLSEEERRLLYSVERPIVLVQRRNSRALSDVVAPHNPLVGLMLPYTPLHHLLLAEVDRPLVMTSANLAEEPIVYRNSEALERLAGIADLFLVHDREIETRCDDSVARVIDDQPVVLRRSRGHVPRPIAVPRQFDQPVLACGAQLKNTFCVAVGGAAHLGPHIGDLDNLETLASFEKGIARLGHFLGVRPQIVAYDLHPGYLSTHYALARPETVKIGVQHHHAHVASVMAEHGLAGPVIGVAYDGTGYGLDGSAWGGEVLIADYEHFERLATFRPLALAGSDAAIRQVWRLALALLDDAFAGQPPLDAFPLFRAISADSIHVIRQMIAAGVQTPMAHGVGRYFDAFGALMLGRAESRYEGQAALEWNCAADGEEKGTYPYRVDAAVFPCELDLRPLVHAAVADFLAGQPAAVISGRFHNAVADATAELVKRVAERVGHLPVVLTGGCFQNALLAERVSAELVPEFSVYRHRNVPPGDGGIALGQALVAGALARNIT